MTRAAVALALLLIVAWALRREPQRVAAWREDDDGVPPLDPWLDKLLGGPA